MAFGDPKYTTACPNPSWMTTTAAIPDSNPRATATQVFATNFRMEPYQFHTKNLLEFFDNLPEDSEVFLNLRSTLQDDEMFNKFTSVGKFRFRVGEDDQRHTAKLMTQELMLRMFTKEKDRDLELFFNDREFEIDGLYSEIRPGWKTVHAIIQGVEWPIIAQGIKE